jgi:4-hydroxybenzoate polyprenyltransferase|tara:strand:+ start:3958 stop:4746 length:789 start_codon:yes stop_codon:yes gene_type:complete
LTSKKIIENLIFSNIWIAFGGVGVTVTTFLYSNLTLNYFFLGLVFFATLFSYNLQNISERKAHKQRSNQIIWIESNNKIIKFITLIALFFSILFSFFSLNYSAVFISSPFLFLVIFYRINFFNKIKFRNIPGLKILIIAICWTWACCILPQILYSINIDWALVCFIFLYVLLITIPFDIRDMEFDKGIKTIPQLIGSRNALFLSFFLIIILFSIFVFFGNYKLCFFLFITCLILLPSLKSKNEFYYLIFIDGLLIILPFFLM